MNFKINIWTLKIDIQIWNFLLKFKKLIWSKNSHLNSKLLFLNPNISISIDHKNGHFKFEYFYLNLKIDISILKFVI
jgi:hypothetical protein